MKANRLFTSLLICFTIRTYFVVLQHPSLIFIVLITFVNYKYVILAAASSAFQTKFFFLSTSVPFISFFPKHFDHYPIISGVCGFIAARISNRDCFGRSFISYINIPFLILNSNDEYIALSEDVPRVDLMSNPNCLYLETEYGGHCDFFGKDNKRLFPKLVVKYF